jgi:RNA polymerase primary sigma factor
MAEVRRIPTLALAEERMLLSRVRIGDRAAMNALVSGNLRFVVAVSWKYRNRGLDLPDLINEGNLGLFRAADHFESGNELRFISYAVWWIRQGILTALARQPGCISIPPERMSKAIRYRYTENKLTQKLGRPPREEEMSEAMGESAKLTASLKALLESMSSTRGLRPAASAPQAEFAAPESDGGVDALAEEQLLRKALKGKLARLGSQEQRVLALRFGFQGACFSLREIGTLFGLTPERIRQIELKALSRLRLATRALGR